MWNQDRRYKSAIGPNKWPRMPYFNNNDKGMLQN